jgi:hypothetical protein
MAIPALKMSQPALPAPNKQPLDPVQQILMMSDEEILRNGIPRVNFVAWRDAFYEGFDNNSSISIHSRMTTWAEKDRLQRKDPNHLQNFDMTFDILYSPAELALPFNQHMQLIHLYMLHHTTFFSPNDPVQQVFIRIMDCLAENLTKRNPELRNAKFFSLPLLGDKKPEAIRFKNLFLLKTAQGWRVGEFDRFPNVKHYVVQFNMNNTKMLILDDKEKPIDRPCNIVQATRRPYIMEKLDYVANIVNPPKVEIILFRGMDALYRGEDNAITFTFDIDRMVNPPQMIRFKQAAPCVDATTKLVSEQDLATAKAEAEVLFESFKPQLNSVQEDEKPGVVFELAAPQSKADKLAVAVHMLSEWKKNPVENAEFIIEAANLLTCEFSESEIADLQSKEQVKPTKEGYEISPAAVVDKLLTTAKTEWKKALAPPEEEPATVPVPQGEIKTEAPQKPTLENQVKKERHKAAVVSEQKRQTAREALEQEGATLQPVSLLGISAKDRDKVESIYAGNPMGAKNFATFAMGLLRKKAAATGAAVQSNTKGSHPKLHVKKADGSSGGVTFKIHHGGDGHGFLAAQKETLRRIFSL